MSFSNYKNINDHKLFNTTLELNQNNNLTPKAKKTNFKKWNDLYQNGARLDQSFDMFFVGSKDVHFSLTALDMMLCSWDMNDLAQALAVIGPIPNISFDHIMIELQRNKVAASGYDGQARQICAALSKIAVGSSGHFNDKITMITPCWAILECRDLKIDHFKNISTWLPIFDQMLPKIDDSVVLEQTFVKMQRRGMNFSSYVMAQVGVHDSLKNTKVYKDMMQWLDDPSPYSLSKEERQEYVLFKADVENAVISLHLPQKSGPARIKKM